MSTFTFETIKKQRPGGTNDSFFDGDNIRIGAKTLRLGSGAIQSLGITETNRTFKIEFDRYAQALRLTPTNEVDGFRFTYSAPSASRRYVVLTNDRVVAELLKGDYQRVPEVEGNVYKLAR